MAGITSAPVSRDVVDATLIIQLTSTALLDTGTRGDETLGPVFQTLVVGDWRRGGCCPMKNPRKFY